MGGFNVRDEFRESKGNLYECVWREVYAIRHNELVHESNGEMYYDFLSWQLHGCLLKRCICLSLKKMLFAHIL